MHARANLITALLTLSLIVPSAASALRLDIPPDVSLPKATSSAYAGWAGYVPGGASQKVAKAITAATTHTTSARGVYNAWAPYVRGGASEQVAKAITAAANTRTGNSCVSTAQHQVPC